jgi:plastocyanin
MRQRKTYVAIAAFLALALAGAALAGVVSRTSRKAVRVTVVEHEYTLTLKHVLAAGPTTFVVVNRGHVAHSLAISGPGLKKQLVGLDAPGKTRLLTVTLKAGTYRLWCPVPGHAALGMKANVRVGSATASSPATTTSGHSGGWG